MKRAAILCLSALMLCGCGVGGNTNSHSYDFEYPTATYGTPVWWEMHENRICKEPTVKIEPVEDGTGTLLESIEVNLDLEDIGFLGINDYFNLIYAAGYESQMPADFEFADPNNWINAKPSTITMWWALEYGPFQGPYTTYYHYTCQIRLNGHTKSAASEPNHLYISYTCTYRP